MRFPAVAVAVTLSLSAAAFSLICASDVATLDEEKTIWDPETKWAGAVAEFAKKDAENPPPEGAVVFYGSSSMRMWELERHFSKRTVVNRGFGGSTTPDAVHFAERWVVPLKPSCILLYEGDNDIKNGHSADEVVANFRALMKIFESKLPGTPVIYVPIKPSIARFTMWPEMVKANRQIEALAAERDDLHYADIVTPMLDFNGLPKSFLFMADGLHLNDVGYTVWTAVIEPMLADLLDGSKANDAHEAKSAKAGKK